MGQRLILFDIDGTLVDTAGAGRRAVHDAFAEVFVLDNGTQAVDGVPFAGLTDWRIFESIGRQAGILEATFSERWEALQEAYVRALRIEMGRCDPRRRALPGVERLLPMLDVRADVILGLLTGNFERGARLKLEPFGLNPFFPTGGFGSDHPERREVARIAVERLSRHAGRRFDPTDVVVVGDTEHDIDCARANGFRAVAVGTGWSSREALESAGPTCLLEDLSDTPAVLQVFGLA